MDRKVERKGCSKEKNIHVESLNMSDNSMFILNF